MAYPKSNQVDNVIKSLEVYNQGPLWGFDDPSIPVTFELFVAGADSLCEYMAGGKDKFTVIFSETAFPGHKLRVDYLDGDMEEGTYYFCKELSQQLWLCPCLSAYFHTTPETIYLDYKN
jgi:uncharacterized protein DUF6717